MLGAILITFQKIFAEKTHFIMYGILGYLAMKDSYNYFSNITKSILLSILFTLAISTGDEIFQGILPYRVGSISDICINFIGGSLGISTFINLTASHKL